MPTYAIQRLTPVRGVYSPVDQTVGETVNLIAVKKGDRIMFGSIQKRIIASTTGGSIKMGISYGTSNGLLLANDPGVGQVGSIVNFNGADLLLAGGELVTQDASIQVTYTPPGSPGTIIPQCLVEVGVIRSQIRG